MRLKLTFKGPNVVSITTKEEPIKIGHAISFIVDTLSDESLSLADIKRIWDIERSFNDLTKGRLYVELLES